MFGGLRATAVRLSAVAKPYPFSSTALFPTPPIPPPTPKMNVGRGLMEYVNKSLPTAEKQQLLENYFKRSSPNCLQPGTVVTLSLTHAPTVFSGVIISIRRRGPDTSFIVRNVIAGTGTELQVFAASPHLKDIKIINRPGTRGTKRARRAKLFYLRDQPEKLAAFAPGLAKSSK